jgi:hypothetical protein
VKLHFPVPEQPPPLHPANRDVEPGAAVRVTIAPTGKSATQFVLLVTGVTQVIPGGSLVTEPPPVPEMETMSSGFRLIVAVTCLSESMLRVQELVPVQAPLQDSRNAEVGLGWRVTVVPVAKLATHADPPPPQLMPGGVLVIAPLPVTSFKLTNTVNGPVEDPPFRICC